MKKFSICLVVLFTAVFVFNSCQKDEDKGNPPALPIEESMALDISFFTNAKSAGVYEVAESTQFNFGAAALTVGIWNTILFINLAVPVTAFGHAFNHEANYIGPGKWQWAYTVNILATKYSARLTGEIRSGDIKWEMYIAGAGGQNFEEFKWFEGTSALDGNSGSWTLFHSWEYDNEEVLTIDWTAKDGKIESTKYTYVRELNDNRETDLGKGGYLEYGRTSEDYNLYYNIHYYDKDGTGQFEDVNIEMKESDESGRMKNSTWQDTDWHCWASDKTDVDCP